MKTLREFKPHERLSLHKKVNELKMKNNLGRERIAEILKISESTARTLLKKKPSNIYGLFAPKPTKELSYIIGVIFGDASIHKTKQGHYQTELKVQDEEFAGKFAKSSSKILSKNPNSIHKQGDYYRTQFSSRLFYNFIKRRTLQKLKPFIEFDFIEFLRGFFDSEGNPHIEAKNCFVVKIGAANTSLEILEYIRELLIEKIGIESRITICNKTGSKAMINGREIIRTKNVYRLMIHRFEDIKKFCNIIGFTAKRKQEKLADAIKKSENYDNSQAIQLWTRFYTKVGREWIKKII